MIRIHPRSSIVSKADSEFSLFMIEQEQKHELSYEELFALLADCSDALSAGMLRAHAVNQALTPKPVKGSKLRAFRNGVFAIQTNHELTYGEWFSILSRRSGEYAKSLIRHERHPNDRDKHGDEA